MSKEKSGTLLILHSLQHIKHVLVDFPSKVLHSDGGFFPRKVLYNDGFSSAFHSDGD